MGVGGGEDTARGGVQALREMSSPPQDLVRHFRGHATSPVHLRRGEALLSCVQTRAEPQRESSDTSRTTFQCQDLGHRLGSPTTL